MNTIGEDLKEAIHDPMPLLGIERFLEIHRALHVRKEHRHLLAFAFDRAALIEDLVG